MHITITKTFVIIKMTLQNIDIAHYKIIQIKAYSKYEIF